MAVLTSYVPLLRRMPLFSDLTPEEAANLLAAAEVRPCARGSILFAQGQAAGSMYVVLEGLIKVYQIMADGRENVLHLCGPGETMAEAAVYQRAAYPASAEALSDARVLRIPAGEVLRSVTENPELALRMIASLSARLREFTHRLGEERHEGAMTRVAGWLSGQLEALTAPTRTVSRGLEIRLVMTRESLAGMLGLSRETVSRCLGELARASIITVSGRRVTVHDPVRLRRLAGQFDPTQSMG